MDKLFHFELPCPACGKPVHVVGDLATHRSRWCCTACLTVGNAPFYVPEEQPKVPVPAGNA
jgi:hypothetical protein